MSGPERLVVLAVQAEESAHAPVRATLKAIAGTDYEVHGVTTARAAIAALEASRRSSGSPTTSGSR